MLECNPQPPIPPAPQSWPVLGLFDVTMLTGSVINAGIRHATQRRRVHSSVWILIAWIVGGLITLAGSLVYAELTRRRPQVGGQYAFLREAYHPVVAFLYGWSLLWIIQSGGMAFVAVVFGHYALELLLLAGKHLGEGGIGELLQNLAGSPFAEQTLAALAIGVLAVIKRRRKGSTRKRLHGAENTAIVA